MASSGNSGPAGTSGRNEANATTMASMPPVSPSQRILQPASTAKKPSLEQQEKMCTTFEVDKNVTFSSAAPPPPKNQSAAKKRFGASAQTGSAGKVVPAGGKPERKRRNFWTEEETRDLLHGCKVHGVGSWKKVLDDPNYEFNNRSATDLKDRYRVCFPEEYKSYTASKLAKKNQALSGSDSEPLGNRDEELRLVQPPLPPYVPLGAKGLGKGLIRELGLGDDFQKIERKGKKPFTPEEDEELLKGFRKYGPEWKKIEKDTTLMLDSRRNTDIRDRFRFAFPALYNVAMDKRYRKKAPRKNKDYILPHTATDSGESPATSAEDEESDGEMETFLFENLCADTGVTWTSYDDMVNEMANFDGYDFFSYYASQNNENYQQENEEGDGNGEDDADQAVDPRLCSLMTPSVASGTSFTPSRLFSRRTPLSETTGSARASPDIDIASHRVAFGQEAPTEPILMEDFLWDNMAAIPFFEVEESSIGSPYQTLHPPPTLAEEFTHISAAALDNDSQDESDDEADEESDHDFVQGEPTTSVETGIVQDSTENADAATPINEAESSQVEETPEPPAERSKSFILKRPVGRPKGPRVSMPKLNTGSNQMVSKRPVGRPKKFLVTSPSGSSFSGSHAQITTKHSAGKPKGLGAGQSSPTSHSQLVAKRPVGRPPKGFMDKVPGANRESLAGPKRPVGRPRKDGASPAIPGKRKEADGGLSPPKKRKAQATP